MLVGIGFYRLELAHYALRTSREYDDALLAKFSIANAQTAPLHVLVIGGGIGGLTLAQGLKKAGVSFAVYERDRTRTDRVQGYRVYISRPAVVLCTSACRRSSSTHLRKLRQALEGHSLVTEHMQVLLSLDDLNTRFDGDGVARHALSAALPAANAALRLRRDRAFRQDIERYEDLGTGRITAHFEDG